MSETGKILITGASGFTGQHACEHFSNTGYDVIAVTRKRPIFCKQNIKIEYCDITDEHAVLNLVKNTKPQFLLHLAGQNHVGDSWVNPVSSIDANVMSTLYLLEAIRKESPLCKVVVIGSALQFVLKDLSTLNHPYSLSKTLQVLISQSWASLYNLNIVIAKPSNLIGPGLSNGVCSIFARKIVDMEKTKSKNVLRVNNLYAKRDFIDVRDAVNAYETLLLKGISGEVYDIASGTNRSLEEVIHVMKSLTKVDFQVKSQTNNQIEETNENLLNKISSLNWKPTIPFKSSINDILTYYREND
ncbi:NAD-dependent epimerase/dehydratase family protein [Halalkalibacter lacteus]|uniref:NAD-dependent epimerase/dehydratase family protein n=1 Tax=Halalkalibacter lacteus TaxID=3090663 RepID=UPI002FCC9CD3